MGAPGVNAPGFPGTSTTAPFNECPAIGYNNSCGLLIVVSNNGEQVLQDNNNGTSAPATTTAGSQTPYDENDDTLVGIVNNSSKPLFAIQLSGSSTSTPIFGFEGDGICTYSAQRRQHQRRSSAPGGTPLSTPGGYTGDSYCSAAQKLGAAAAVGPDPNGSDYQGPTSTFSNISSDTTTGVVNFAVCFGPRAVDVLLLGGVAGLQPGERPVRLLGGRIRWWNLLLRRPVLRLNGWQAAQSAHRGHRRRPVLVATGRWRPTAECSRSTPGSSARWAARAQRRRWWGMVRTPSGNGYGWLSPTAASSTMATPSCTAQWAASR